jgi:glycosyltransferase involved in cell wall biosynthesis
VTFAGYVPQERTAPYYRSADLFALPSTFDNAPNAVLEAMASRLPVVATDVGGVRGILGGPDGGALVPAGDARALARAIESLLSNTEHARAVGERNRNRVVERFSKQASARRLLEIYTRVLAESRRSARLAS